MSAVDTNKKSEMTKKSTLFDIEEQFSFYGAYHTNTVNVNIHILCVPVIFWTATIMLNMAWPKTFASFPWQAGDFESSLNITPGFLVAVGYAAYFIALEPLGGLLYAPILLMMGYTSSTLLQNYPEASRIAVGAHIVSWIAQFIGHGAFEGRAPALLDNLLQSLVLAVFFVFLEVLFFFGYKPELHHRIQNRIGVKVTEFRKEKAAEKRAKSS